MDLAFVTEDKRQPQLGVLGTDLSRDAPKRLSRGRDEVVLVPLSVAVFSDATSFKTKRRDFFKKLRIQADHILKVESGPESSLSFTREKDTPLLSA